MPHTGTISVLGLSDNGKDEELIWSENFTSESLSYTLTQGRLPEIKVSF